MVADTSLGGVVPIVRMNAAMSRPATTFSKRLDNFFITKVLDQASGIDVRRGFQRNQKLGHSILLREGHGFLRRDNAKCYQQLCRFHLFVLDGVP